MKFHRYPTAHKGLSNCYYKFEVFFHKNILNDVTIFFSQKTRYTQRLNAAAIALFHRCIITSSEVAGFFLKILLLFW